MDPICLSSEVSTAIIGAASMGVMTLARFLIGWANNLSGVTKMLVSFGAMPQALSVLADLVPGVEVRSLADLTVQGVAEPFAAGLVSVALWQITKEVMKWRGRYNLTPMVDKT